MLLHANTVNLQPTEKELPLVLKRVVQYVRHLMVDMIYHANIDAPRRGHYGSSTSSVELYVTELARLVNPYKDLIAWKPHASPVVYVLISPSLMRFKPPPSVPIHMVPCRSS